mgnify:CR=1 FL=1
MTPTEKARDLIQFYDGRKTAKEISEESGLSLSKVYKVAEKLKIKFRNPRRVSDSTERVWVEKLLETHTVAQAATKTRFSYNTVKKLQRALELEKAKKL